jgi:uncharacterized membrane protein YozB (DUF420 family)
MKNMFIFFISAEMRRPSRDVIVEVLLLTCITIGILAVIGFTQGVNGLEPVISFIVAHRTVITTVIFIYVCVCAVIFTTTGESEARKFAVGALIHALLMLITFLILIILGRNTEAV